MFGLFITHFFLDTLFSGLHILGGAFVKRFRQVLSEAKLVINASKR